MNILWQALLHGFVVCATCIDFSGSHHLILKADARCFPKGCASIRRGLLNSNLVALSSAAA
jgi:hypothetical protein